MSEKVGVAVRDGRWALVKDGKKIPQSGPQPKPKKEDGVGGG